MTSGRQSTRLNDKTERRRIGREEEGNKEGIENRKQAFKLTSETSNRPESVLEEFERGSKQKRMDKAQSEPQNGNETLVVHRTEGVFSSKETSLEGEDAF